MPLSNSDIARITHIGFSEGFFVQERNGVKRLRNRLGRCVFHNGEMCTIYADRPEGCRIYPVVLNVDMKRAVHDRGCPNRERFRITRDTSRRLIKLVRTLDSERDARLKSRH
jgi:Fe-S-cluster containining protein